jgi:hypothetical protein
MKRIAILLIVLSGLQAALKAQGTVSSLNLFVADDKGKPVEGATISLFRSGGTVLAKTAISGNAGLAVLGGLGAGKYYVQVSHAGFATYRSVDYTLPLPSAEAIRITLVPGAGTLQGITVTGKKPFVQHVKGKVVVNPEASVTNTGTTVLEVLEKSPGVLVDKNGGISLQGKSGVLVLIDDKPTYLSGTELSNLLSSMSSTQVEQIELMANPPARYDASGNAGVINIKTKKNKQKGFNGILTLSGGQGVYSKSNNSLVLNYRRGKWNSFLSYSMNYNKYFTDIYALRKYYDANGNVTSMLDQPTYYAGRGINNTVRAGVDFYAAKNTTIGLTGTGVIVNRKGWGEADATWLNAAGAVDSAIGTYSTSMNRFKNGSLNLNLKQVIGSRQELSVDVDWLNYDINNSQAFNNKLLAPGGYHEASSGDVPSAIHIISGKADHVLRLGKEGKLESGWKSSHISTDNLADYQLYDGVTWSPDYNKSNHFLYKENIHALYSSIEQKMGRFSMQAGLRYEYTQYDANQLGNTARKDSSFSRDYSGLFPSGYVAYMLDSSNTFTLTAGRRIDRPAFQKLNPFVVIINKYTYQRGNPYFLPQYSWNLELSHQYKQWLTSTVSYSLIKNYFSQLFINEGGDILTYTEGNVGKMYNLSASVAVQASPLKWWSLTGQAIFNYKELKGYDGNTSYTSSISQFNVNINNQFKFAKVYTAELSGFYTGRARNDLQEVLYPTGQVSVGLSRPVLKKKGTLRVSMRDIFYTQAMEGLTDFEGAEEYFILKRDTRVFTIGFTYRFGKTFKTSRRNNGGAGDEMQRVGNGN